MIAHLKGELTDKSPAYIVVDVNGVGYQVFVSLSTYCELPEPGSPVTLRIHTHVREDELRLFGFATEVEQKIFGKLITISKVGPKLALTILSGMSPQDLLDAIAESNVSQLNSIPGVGQKTAERLVLEMKDKLKDLGLEVSAHIPSSPKNGLYNDALSALINLGYKKPAVEKAINNVTGNSDADPSLENLIKECLKILS